MPSVLPGSPCSCGSILLLLHATRQSPIASALPILLSSSPNLSCCHKSVSKCVDALAKHHDDEHEVDTWASVFHLGTGFTVREDGIGCCCAPEFDGSLHIHHDVIITLALKTSRAQDASARCRPAAATSRRSHSTTDPSPRRRARAAQNYSCPLLPTLTSWAPQRRYSPPGDSRGVQTERLSMREKNHTPDQCVRT
jgi:hypothetical protein